MRERRASRHMNVAGRSGLRWDKGATRRKQTKQASVLSSPSESNPHVELDLVNSKWILTFYSLHTLIP